MADTNRVINATLSKYVKSLESEWPEALPLFSRVFERGNVAYGQGGLDQRWQVEKSQNPNWETFNNFQQLTLNATDATTQLTLEYGQYRSTDFLPKREILQNQGSAERIYALEESKVRYLMDSARDDLGNDCHNGAGGKEIVGMQTALPDTNFTSKTYGGVAFTGNSWHQPTQVDGDGFANSDFQTDALRAIETAKLGASHGKMKSYPDSMLTTQAVYTIVSALHTSNERYRAETNRKLGGTGLMVHDMEMVWDRDAKASTIYGLSMENISLHFMTDSIFHFEREVTKSPAGILYYLECWPLLKFKSTRNFFTIHNAA